VSDCKKPMLAPIVGRIAPASKKSFPMMPWFPANFMSSTRGWPLTARGIYRELLDCQWEMGSIPADPSALQRLTGASASEWKLWSIVQDKFPLCSDGVRRNPRLEKHRSESARLSKLHRLGADKTNAKRWGTPSQANDDGRLA